MNQNEIAELVRSVGSGNYTVGGRKVRRKVIYINANVSAKSGTFQLVEQKTDKVVGITNLDGGDKFSKGRDVIVLAVKVGVDTGTAVPQEATYKNQPLAALANGELRIIQGEELASFPISVLANPGTATKVDDNFFKTAPIFLKSQTAFKFEVETPAAIAATTCLSLMLDTLEFVD